MNTVPPSPEEGAPPKHSPQAVEFVQFLFGALRNRQLYPPGHKLLVASVERLVAALPDALGGQPELNIGIIDDRVILGEYPLSQGLSPSRAQLAPLRAREIERVSLDRETAPEEIEALLDVLASDPGDMPAADKLVAAGVRSIRIGRLSSGNTDEGGARSMAELYNELYRNAVLAVRDLIGLCHQTGNVAVAAGHAAVEQVVQNACTGNDGLVDLTNLPQQDEESFSHALNTCILAVSLGRSFGLPQRELHDLGTAALLHDIGKSLLPEELVHKEVELTAEERELLERHPVLGANLLRKLSGVGNISARVAFEHHIGFDGLGYPRRTAHTPLHLASHIVAIANTYDNLRGRRGRREEMTCERALRIMAKEVGGAFEPTLLKRFVNHLGLYPKGTLVLLSDGTIGLVKETRNGHPLMPRVLVIQNQARERLATPHEVDLWESAKGEAPLRIVESRDARMRGFDPLAYFG
jgi:HD-GYP domain-containing protein (c-di-GMP phosphodiesterase class II)